MITSSTASPGRPARSSTARLAAAPSWAAVMSLKSPRKPPMGVRAALTITMESLFMASSLLGGHAQRAIQADGLAVEHAVLDDVTGQRGVLRRTAKARRERHVGGQGVLYLL